MAEKTNKPVNPEDLLRNEIINDAQRQAKRLVRRAQQDAEKIMATTESANATFKEKALLAARGEADHAAKLQQAKVPIAQHRLRAQYVEERLNELRATAARRLAATEMPLDRAALLNLIAQAVKQMRGTSFVVRLSAAERELLGDSFQEELRQACDKEALEIELGTPLDADECGPLVSDVNGRQQWDNRLTARLQRMWPELRRRIYNQELGLSKAGNVG